MNDRKQDRKPATDLVRRYRPLGIRAVVAAAMQAKAGRNTK